MYYLCSVKQQQNRKEIAMEMNQKTAKFGRAELTFSEMESLYEQGKCYIVNGNRIYQLVYSNALRMFYGMMIYKNANGTFTKSSRFFAYNENQVNDLLGFELLNSTN